MGKEKRAIGIAMVLLGASFWGIGGTVSQRLFQESGMSVNWLVTIRLLIAGMLLIGLAWIKDRNKVFHVWKDRRDAVKIMSGTFLLLTNGSAGALAVPVPAVVWGLLSAIALAFYTLYP